MCSQVENGFQSLLVARIAHHFLQCDLQRPARQDHQQADRRNHRQGLQDQVHNNLSLDLDLIGPSAVERHKLLLRSQPVVENALDGLLRADVTQPFDSFGIRFCGGFVAEVRAFFLQRDLISRKRRHVGLGQLLRLGHQIFPAAQGPPG